MKKGERGRESDEGRELVQHEAQSVQLPEFSLFTHFPSSLSNSGQGSCEPELFSFLLSLHPSDTLSTLFILPHSTNSKTSLKDVCWTCTVGLLRVFMPSTKSIHVFLDFSVPDERRILHAKREWMRKFERNKKGRKWRLSLVKNIDKHTQGELEWKMNIKGDKEKSSFYEWI